MDGILTANGGRDIQQHARSSYEDSSRMHELHYMHLFFKNLWKATARNYPHKVLGDNELTAKMQRDFFNLESPDIGIDTPCVVNRQFYRLCLR
jgi:hypothetical protein